MLLSSSNELRLCWPSALAVITQCTPVHVVLKRQSGYKLITELIPQFEKLDDIPLDIGPRRLDDGDGIGNS